MAKLLPLTLAIACNAELILDGGDNGWSQWYRSVDGVMGGRSSISVQRDGDVLEASGEIVTAGGGFAGLYTRLNDVDASAYAGLKVTYEALPAGQTPLAWEVRLTAKPAPTDDATGGRGDHSGSKKKQSKGSEWPVVVGVVLALAFLMILGIGCSLWARGARVDPSDSKAAAAAPNEETEEPLQVV